MVGLAMKGMHREQVKTSKTQLTAGKFNGHVRGATHSLTHSVATRG